MKKPFLHNKFLNIMILILGILYALFMIRLLFLRGHPYHHYMYNIIPFHTISEYIKNQNHFNFNIWFDNLFGNIVLFIPLGFLIPMLNTRFLGIIPFLICVVVLLFMVEFIQLITKVGSFDVDDVILNSFGALIGFLVTISVVKIMKKTSLNRLVRRSNGTVTEEKA